MISYKTGINLGGWISQYKEFSDEHFSTFITEKDIRVIAESGFDHVRLPFDYPVLESDDNPGSYLEKGVGYIDDCLEWCKKYNIGLILDMHHAPGYRFQDLDSNTLFEDEEQQNRFINIWLYLTKRYIQERKHVVFELLNEIVEPDSSRWNALLLETIKKIRGIDQSRIIYIGGNNYNSPDELKNLPEIKDDYIVYNFHFYNPFFFTHQKAYWSKRAMDYNREVHYPGKYEGIEEHVAKYPEYDYMLELANLNLDIKLLEEDLTSALEFQKKQNCKLYCGEYGVIGLTDMESRETWHRDFVSLLKKYDIGGAVWSYKEMDFPIFDNDGKALSERLLKNIIG